MCNEGKCQELGQEARGGRELYGRMRKKTRSNKPLSKGGTISTLVPNVHIAHARYNGWAREECVCGGLQLARERGVESGSGCKVVRPHPTMGK